MKKAIALLSLLVFMLALAGCNEKTVHIDFPFEVGEVETIELYSYTGAPVSAEKKVTDSEVLAPGENRHSGPGENRQFWPDENRQSLFTI